MIKNKDRLNSGLGNLFTAIIIIALWQIASLHYNDIILPGPMATLKSLVNQLGDNTFYSSLLTSCVRLLTALALSIGLGLAFGLLMGIFKPVRYLLSPVIYILQSVPPILYMTLAMIWFGLNGRATIFIVTVVSFPVLAVNLCEGFSNIDPKLVEMGRSFQFSRSKIILSIIIPSLLTYLKSGLIIMLSLSWKLLIMGEVLAAGSGIGSLLTDARMNLETDKVFSLGLLIVIFCILSQLGAGKMVEHHDNQN
ncbi:MAG: ABC transporter permease [Spirochaetales bacterium]|nr:ABC transporter permease [Spirochaetales bacterium]